MVRLQLGKPLESAVYGKIAKALSVRLAIVFYQSERTEFNFSLKIVTTP